MCNFQEVLSPQKGSVPYRSGKHKPATIPTLETEAGGSEDYQRQPSENLSQSKRDLKMWFGG